MKKYTLTNSFHGTSATILVPENEDIAGYFIDLEYRAMNGDKAAKAKIRRYRRTLCGVEGCKCGTIL